MVHLLSTIACLLYPHIPIMYSKLRCACSPLHCMSNTCCNPQWKYVFLIGRVNCRMVSIPNMTCLLHKYQAGLNTCTALSLTLFIPSPSLPLPPNILYSPLIPGMWRGKLYTIYCCLQLYLHLLGMLDVVILLSYTIGLRSNVTYAIQYTN